MSYNLTKFEANNLSTGVQTFTSDFSPHVRFSLDTKNVTTGIRQGVGPRFGMAPIPGQADTEAPLDPSSVRASEGTTSGTAYQNRIGYDGIYRIMSDTFNTFAWIVKNATNKLDVLLGSTAVVNPPLASLYTPASTITAGLHTPMRDSVFAVSGEFYRCPAYWLIPGNFPNDATAPSSLAWQTNYMTQSSNFISTDYINVTGKEIPQKFLIGIKAGSAVGSNACSEPNFNLFNLTTGRTYVTGGFYKIQNSKITGKKHAVNMYEMVYYNPTNRLIWQKVYTYTETDLTTFSPTVAHRQDSTVVQLVPTDTATTKAPTSVPTGSVNSILFSDPDNTINSGYEAVLLAADHAWAVIYQNWMENLDGTLCQYVDLSNIEPWPKTVAVTSGSTLPTSWFHPPGIVTPSSIISSPGILRAKTTYEFAYSYFNKRLDFETNVGEKISVTTDTDDYVCASVAPSYIPIINATSAHSSLPVNDYNIRFYYRVQGSFEWLPAGEVECSRFICGIGDVLAGDYQDVIYSFICREAIALSVGPQPGGFNDYSRLQPDNYDCVVTWQGRAFWTSKKSLVFSMRENIFAYPIRNSVSCPSGEFRGVTVHAFPGQAAQRGRLIVWGSEECYIATFNGNPVMQSVQVSANTTGSFPLDGSDFVMERWTTNTAFSHRAAVVADGELWYWGGKGIFHDNGTDFGDRVSISIEPDIFNIYDPSQTDTIFAHYFAQTKEIYWFYTPKTAPTLTHALVLNTNTGGIYRAEFNCKIDSIQDISIENTADTQVNLTGKRTIVSVRADSGQTVQRPYFFDLKNRSGDLRPGVEAVVKQIAATGLSSVLTLAGGSAPSVSIGDYVAIHQASDYSGTVIPDMIARVTNVSPLTISTPVALSNWTASARKNYFPIWIAPLTQIPYRIKTQYWTPTGMQSWYRFLFSHFQFRVTLWPSLGNYNLNLGYRTPISGTSGSKTITLSDNSDGNCQIYAALPGDLQKIEGQGIQHDIAGVHNGSEWVLQYLSTHGEAQLDGDFLLTFEG